MGLNQALQMQTMVYQTYGPQNGLVSLTNIRNTLADMLATTGVRNADRYFAPITPEIEAQMLQMQQAGSSSTRPASRSKRSVLAGRADEGSSQNAIRPNENAAGTLRRLRQTMT